ncbi:hypothetical protein [Rhizobium sp. BK176]|uniref:hypothetical protein n=1 Tax=Rhizobium sp. BK176 TaxID=2587071 RepID=UPI002167620C|nr:hypothetical protein [Rhizobium sp. BK176]MCS4090216.1 hypothetical protein [Rhizobium sp. BK176]
MRLNITVGYALIVSEWDYHVTRFRTNPSGNIRFDSVDDDGDYWSFEHYHSEYDVYYWHDGVDLVSSVHVIACGPSIEDVASIELPHPTFPFAGGQLMGVPDVLLAELAELVERPDKHPEFARKREVLCSGPILYRAFVATKSVSAAQELMLSAMDK